MDLIGEIVVHKVFGEGTIINHTEDYLTISFKQGEKKFVYPDAFKAFLKARDPSVDKAINQELIAIEDEKIRTQEEPEEPAAPMPKKSLVQTVAPAKVRTKIVKKKVFSRYNIAFKCNYCDGGNSHEQIGYNGICSDPVIHNNIKIEKRVWCNSADCPCSQYYNGEITRNELDEIMSGPENSQFVCYESQMLRDWRALAGIVQTGKNKGRPLTLNNVQPNSLCVLTTRDPDAANESERYIFAVFLVDETYTGDSREEGYVTTSSEYKIKLSPEEARAMLFWKYHANTNQPDKTFWSTGLFRYFEDEQAALILRDIALIKHGTKDETLAQNFYSYFCQSNKIDISQLGEPNGAHSRE